MDLILNISIIKNSLIFRDLLCHSSQRRMSLEAFKKSSTESFYFSIYFATKRNLNFLLKNNMLHSLPQRQCTMIDLCWERHHEREPLAIVKSFISLPDTPTTPPHTHIQKLHSALSSCQLANFLHHDTKTLLVRIILAWRKASVKPGRLRWNAHCLLNGHGVLRVLFMKD